MISRSLPKINNGARHCTNRCPRLRSRYIDRPDTQWAHHIVSVHELFTSPEQESIDASNTQEETTDRDQLDTRHFSSEDSHRPCNFPQQISDHSPEDNFTGQQQVTSTDDNVFDEIPQLEEDWEMANLQMQTQTYSIFNTH